VEAILAFLTLDPAQRADANTIRSFPLMQGLDWDNILDMPAPFVPQPEDATDTAYFAMRNNLQGLTVSEVDL
jgi:serine/threonine-protein kinase greatwall